MPQMMPLNWILLMIFFIFIYILFNIMNYYMINYNIKSNKEINNFSKNLMNMNWKW